MTYRDSPFTWNRQPQPMSTTLMHGSAVADTDSEDDEYGGRTPTAARALSPADTLKNVPREKSPLLGFKQRWYQATRSRQSSPTAGGLAVARKPSAPAAVDLHSPVSTGKSTYYQSVSLRVIRYC